jgi:hypothetical protein
MAVAERDALIVARRVARWHIGDPSWADLIVNAYLNPDAAMAQLQADQKEST